MVYTVEMSTDPYSHSMTATAPETKRANETSDKSEHSKAFIFCGSCCCLLIIIGIVAVAIHLWLVFGYGKFLVTHTNTHTLIP